MKPNITQQINDYVRSQQQLMKQRQNAGIKKAGIKKADSTLQDASAFTLPSISKTNVNRLNQLIQS